MSGRIHLWDCKDPEEYKAIEAQGKGEFETPVYHPDAETINIQSRPWDGDEVHEVSIRILRPKGQPKGIFMFIHGGKQNPGAFLPAYDLPSHDIFGSSCLMLTQEKQGASRPAPQRTTTTSSWTWRNACL